MPGITNSGSVILANVWVSPGRRPKAARRLLQGGIDAADECRLSDSTMKGQREL